MKLPKSIRVAGQTVKIQQRDLSDDDCFGVYYPERKLIVISTGLSDKKTRETLRHELMHACLDISGLSSCTNFEEEAIVRCFDTHFFTSWTRLEKRLGNE